MKFLVAILIFAVIILIHEFGHFILARINGIEVTEFCIGFGPKLCKFHALKTVFSIRLLPLGGACMMKGAEPADGDGKTIEFDTEDPHSFFSKNPWQRVAVLFAGPFFNFVLAFILSVFVIGIAGYDPATVIGVQAGSNAENAGLLPGDEVLKINGSKIVFSRELDGYLDYHTLNGKPVSLTVKRGTEKVKLSIVPEHQDRYMLGFSYSANGTELPKILEISAGYPMEKAGMMAGDVITAIDGHKMTNSGELENYLDTYPLTDRDVVLNFLRDGREMTATVTPMHVGSGYSLGFTYNIYREKVGAFKTLRYSLREVRYWIVETGRGLIKLVTGKLKSNEIGSAVAVVDVIGETYETSKQNGVKDTVLNLMYITILLSANIGVMNLLPIPGLDGGKLLFCAIEIVRGKPVDRSKEALVTLIGMALLLILMVFLIFNDIKNIFF